MREDGALLQDTIKVLSSAASVASRNELGKQEGCGRRQTADYHGLQSTARRTRAGIAAFQIAKNTQRGQGYGGRVCQPMHRVVKHNIRGKRNHAARDVGPRDRGRAGQGSSWIRFLQAKFK